MVTVKQFMPTRKEWLVWLFRDAVLGVLFPSLSFIGYFRKLSEVRILPNSEIAYGGDYAVSETDDIVIPGWQFTRLITGHTAHYGLYIIHIWNNKRYVSVRIGYEIKPDADHSSAVATRVKVTTVCNIRPYGKLPITNDV